MTDKPPEPEDNEEAERRFNKTLGRMLDTPPKPHTMKAKTDRKPVPKKVGGDG